MSTHIWLRAEDKALEERVVLTPSIAKLLLQAGFNVTVEKSRQSAFNSASFAAVGCALTEPGSWRNSAKDTIILGLKELAESNTPLIHRHIHFAHVYKNQAGWKQVLNRFKQGNGVLYDLEYLTQESGRRVAAFGYWAGFTGAAVALEAWAGQKLGRAPVLSKLISKKDKQDLMDQLIPQLNQVKEKTGVAPKVLLIGALGRSGQGAVELVESVEADLTCWDLAETKKGGPFREILDFDVLVNCVFVQQKIPAFLTLELLQQSKRRLSVISDVSCDPYGEYNPLPIYKQCTTFDNPTLRIIGDGFPLDLISIDHLPSMLPIESSEDFCQQLAPYLLQLDDLRQGVWARAYQVFIEKSKAL